MCVVTVSTLIFQSASQSINVCGGRVGNGHFDTNHEHELRPNHKSFVTYLQTSFGVNFFLEMI